MPLLLFPLLLLPDTSTVVAEQNELIWFEGVVLTPDSLPAENAYLISYQTLRAWATSANGSFGIYLHRDDSLMVHHMGCEKLIVKPLGHHPQKIILKYSSYEIEPVSVKFRDEVKEQELKNLSKNWEVMMLQLKKEYHCNYQSGFVSNPYNPSKQHTGMLELNFIELIDRIARKRKERK